MSKRIELKAGQSLSGYLSFVEEAPKKGRHRYIVCECSCGKRKAINLSHVVSGRTVSCGCIMRKVMANIKSTHGLSQHELYGTWLQMLNRCNNPDAPAYDHYGGRGISVCPEWQDPEMGLSNFIRDMGERPEGCTIDRIDNSAGYSRNNCEWVRHSMQVRNRNKYKNKTSKYKGVCFDSKRNKWRANIRIKGRQTYLGEFEAEDQAYEAYCEAYEKESGRKPPEYFESKEGATA